MDLDTAYELFELPRFPRPSEAKVKRAYLNLSRIYHPDKGGTDILFQNLGNARDAILKDLESPQQHTPTGQHTPRQQPTSRQQPTPPRPDGSDIPIPSWETMYDVHREENRPFREVMEEQAKKNKERQEAETRAFQASLKRRWAAENAGYVRHPQWNDNGEDLGLDEEDTILWETRKDINALIYKLIQRVVNNTDDNQKFFDIIDKGNDEQAIKLFDGYLTTEKDIIVVNYKKVFHKIIREKIKEIAWEYYKEAGGWAFGWGNITNTLKPFLIVMYRDCKKLGAGDYGIWKNCKKTVRRTDFTEDLDGLIKEEIKNNEEMHPKRGGKNNKKHKSIKYKSRKHKSIKYKSRKYKSRKHKSIKYKSSKYKYRTHKSRKHKYRKQIL